MPVAPAFLLNVRFGDLTDWWLCLECCGRTVNLPFRLLAGQRPQATLGALLRALRCRECGERPDRAVMLAGPADRRPHRFTAPGGWRIEIVLPDQVTAD